MSNFNNGNSLHMQGRPLTAQQIDHLKVLLPTLGDRIHVDLLDTTLDWLALNDHSYSDVSVYSEESTHLFFNAVDVLQQETVKIVIGSAPDAHKRIDYDDTLPVGSAELESHQFSYYASYFKVLKALDSNFRALKTLSGQESLIFITENRPDLVVIAIAASCES